MKSKNRVKLLESFPNSFPNRDYVIIHQANEFTSVCPKTGQPDFGMITIKYIADKKCVELKSLKFYLQSYRNDGIFYENVTNTILDDLISVLKPRWMEIVGDFTVRGGLQSKVIATYPDNKS
ncbi:MAG TPA: preQ(1) synthase [Ignavibacteria bacterium]|nr:preQ(1) synthase [Ignavibacteria bacterium]